MTTHTLDLEKVKAERLQARFRGVAASRTFQNVREYCGLGHKRVLDIGCGSGEYLVLCGDESVGITTAYDEVENGTHMGLDIRYGNAEKIDELELPTHDVVWCNNLIEHILSPHEFLMKLRTRLQKEQVVFGVPVIPLISGLMRFRKFRGSLAFSHINFFTRDSLVLTIERAGYTVESVRPFVFRNALMDRLVAWCAPHIYVIARKNEAFAYSEKKIHEWENEPGYQRVMQMADTK